MAVALEASGSRDASMATEEDPDAGRHAGPDAEPGGFSESVLTEFRAGQPTMARLREVKPGTAIRIGATAGSFTSEVRAQSAKALLELHALSETLVESGWDGDHTRAVSKDLAGLIPSHLRDFIRGEWAERGATFLASHGVEFLATLMGGRPCFIITPGNGSPANRLAERARVEGGATFVVFDPELMVLKLRAGGMVAERPRSLYLGVRDLVSEAERSPSLEHEFNHLARLLRRDRLEDDPSLGTISAIEHEGASFGLPGSNPLYGLEHSLDEPEAYLTSLRELLRSEAARNAVDPSPDFFGAGRRYAAHMLSLALRGRTAVSMALRALDELKTPASSCFEWSVQQATGPRGAPPRFEALLKVPWGSERFLLAVPLQRSQGPSDPDNLRWLEAQLRWTMRRSNALASHALLASKVLDRARASSGDIRRVALAALDAVLNEGAIAEAREVGPLGEFDSSAALYSRVVSSYNRATSDGSLLAQ